MMFIKQNTGLLRSVRSWGALGLLLALAVVFGSDPGKPALSHQGQGLDSGKVVLAQSQSVSAVITVDNVFQLCYGPGAPTSLQITCVGDDDNFITVHNYTLTPSPSDYIYIAAWSDKTMQQGFLGEFSIGSTIIRTGDPGFEVCPTNDNKNTLAQKPGPTGLAPDIMACNNNSQWVAPVVGQQAPWLWAGIVGFDPAAGNPAELTKFTPPFPKWIWHDAGPAAQVQVGSGNPAWYNCNGSDRPFNAGCNHQEYLIFRLPVKALQTPCVQPPSGLDHWWPFEETLSIVYPSVKDIVGGRDGTTKPGPVSTPGSPTSVPGMVGNAFEFDGSSAFVEVLDGPGTLSYGNPGQGFSIDAWVNVKSADKSGVRPIVDKRFDFPDAQNPNVHTRGYAFFLFNGQLGFQLADDMVAGPGGLGLICDAGPPFTANCTNYVSSADVADGNWHHVTVTVQRPGNVTLYVDGVVVLTRGARTGNANNGIALLIGTGYPIVISKPYFKGLIDELEIFNRALTQQEIQGIFNAGPAGKCKPKSVLSDQPLQCVRPEVTTVLQAGENDNFNPNPDTPPAAPTPAFVAATGSPPPPLAGFDSTTHNRHFLHSFTGLPGNITQAQLEIRLKPLPQDIPQNDTLNLWGGIAAVTPLEGHHLGGGNPNNLLTQVWNTTSFPNGHVFLLNLSTVVVTSMNSGALHIQVQDDTSVDYVILRLCTKPEGKAEVCVFKFEDKNGDGVHQPSTEPLLGGWQFNVSPGPPNQVTTTPQGGICFGVTAPGTYTITEIVQAGWTPTTPTSQTVTVAPSQLVNLFFGNKKKEEGKCDLAIKKTVDPNPPVIGQPFAFAVTVTNVGTAPCPPTTTVTDNLPSGFNVTLFNPNTGAGWTCPSGPPNIVCNNATLTLQPGQSSMVFAVVGTMSPGIPSIENCAELKNPNDTNPANNKDCIKVTLVQPPGKCDLAIKKEVKPSPLVSGQQATFTITVTNVGNAPCPGPTTVTETVPTGLTLVSASGPGWVCIGPVCTYALPIPVGGSVSVTYTFNVTAPPGTAITNCATVSNPNDTNPANNQACVTTPVVPGVGVCDREIKKTVTPNPVQSGGTVTITLTVTNVGTAPCPVVAGVNVADPKPTGLTFNPPVTTNNPAWSCGISGPSGTWPGGVQCTATNPLLAGQTVTITFTATVTAPAGSSIQNCAEVTNVGEGPATQANNKSCVTIQVSGRQACTDVTINLSTGVAPWTVTPGTVGVITNLGPLSGTWVTPTAPVRWIQPANAATPQLLPGGFYQYSVPFTLPGPLTQYSSISLSGRYAADNTVHQFFVGPAQVAPGGPLCQPANANCFSAWTPFSITATAAFTAGPNNLNVRVFNNPTSGGGPTYTGLVVEATLRAICK